MDVLIIPLLIYSRSVGSWLLADISLHGLFIPHFPGNFSLPLWKTVRYLLGLLPLGQKVICLELMVRYSQTWNFWGWNNINAGRMSFEFATFKRFDLWELNNFMTFSRKKALNQNSCTNSSSSMQIKQIYMLIMYERDSWWPCVRITGNGLIKLLTYLVQSGLLQSPGGLHFHCWWTAPKFPITNWGDGLYSIHERIDSFSSPF